MFFFFFNDTATTEIYTLSLHDALPISPASLPRTGLACAAAGFAAKGERPAVSTRAPRTRSRPCFTLLTSPVRSEEHTSELQSRLHLVCRLLLEKKKERIATNTELSRTT